VQGLGLRISDFGLWASEFGSQVWGLGFRVLGFESLVSGLGSRACQGSGVRVSGFGCMVYHPDVQRASVAAQRLASLGDEETYRGFSEL